MGGYYAWKRGIEAAAQAELMVRQLEAAAQDLKKANEDLQKVVKAADEVKVELEAQVDSIRDRNKDLEEAISAMEDRAASDVLKKAVGGIKR